MIGAYGENKANLKEAIHARDDQVRILDMGDAENPMEKAAAR